jgi:hypothetical protein
LCMICRELHVTVFTFQRIIEREDRALYCGIGLLII